jgi:hypothetical protein
VKEGEGGRKRSESRAEKGAAKRGGKFLAPALALGPLASLSCWTRGRKEGQFFFFDPRDGKLL